MFKKTLALILLASVFVGIYSINLAFADNTIPTNIPVSRPSTTTQAPTVSCLYDVPEAPTYTADVVSVRHKFKVGTNEEFRVKVFLKNTGNVPWFSNKSGCSGSVVNLGTDLDRDHPSMFYSPKIKKIDNNWVGTNRVGMDQLRVEPGQVASFTFWTKMNIKDVLKEFFTPVVEGIGWIDSARFDVSAIVGEVDKDPTDLWKMIQFAGQSGSILDYDLNGQKLISVDLSEQKMRITLDGKLVRDFTVSTGGPKTPTPVGTYNISLKQEVRVGSKEPHYVMPNFMMFRNDGYGIHSLPSLSRKGGDTFWTEAREHIGIPVSHGCVRVLPEDAAFVYSFADIGTTVAIQK